jgi:hypothetical protein
MNNNPEQPEDLFDWGAQQEKPSQEIKFASPDDGLGWECAQCELFGHTCPECSAKQKAEQSNIVPIEGHTPKPSDEISVAEAIAMMNEVIDRSSGEKAS